MNPFATNAISGFKPPMSLSETSGFDSFPTGKMIPMQAHETFFAPEVNGPANFQDVMMNTLQSVNETAQKPDSLLREAMITGRVDIHDVMIANSKAELAVNMTSAVLTKVIQAYDRILQIQV